MSKARIAASFTTVAAAALVAARLAVWFFPLHSSAQTVMDIPDSPGVTVDAGAPLLHRAPVVRPNGIQATGTVVIDATLDSKGEVSDARVVSGPDELRRAALTSVLQWHYSPDPLPASPVLATIQFGAAPAGVAGGIRGGVAGGIAGGVKDGAGDSSYVANGPVTLKSIQFIGVPDDLAQKVRAALPIHEGDQVPPEVLKLPLKGIDEHVSGGLSQIDEHLAARLSINANHEATLTVMLDTPAAPAFIAAPAAAAPGSMPQRIRVGGNVQQANLIRKVAPLYPPDAKAARIQGLVRLSVVIGKDGAVENIDVVSGEPMLVQSAMDAVKQWQYKPTLLNGNPVEVITTVDVNYTLTQ